MQKPKLSILKVMPTKPDVALDPATFEAGKANLAHARSLAASNTAMRDMFLHEARFLADEESKPDEPKTPLQKTILAKLDGKGLTKEALAAACQCEPSRLYRPGGIRELMETGEVENKRKVGYYRPDAPPN